MADSRVFPRQTSYHFNHDPARGFSVFLERRCKRVYFIRHAEGFHNVAEHDDVNHLGADILLEENSGRRYWDARLTPKGEQQCQDLAEEVKGMDHPLDLELVVVSPLTRTLQTAELSLGKAGEAGAPPYLANEMCRERIADYMCDGRRSVTELHEEFGGVDFSLVKDDEDSMFYNNKEGDLECKARAVAFLEWLAGRPETRIAVVTHSIFLKNLFHQFGFDVEEHDKQELRAFPKNAEMRGVMLCAHRRFGEEEEEEEEAENGR